jgi:hypothetical protein
VRVYTLSAAGPVLSLPAESIVQALRYCVQGTGTDSST